MKLILIHVLGPEENYRHLRIDDTKRIICFFFIKCLLQSVPNGHLVKKSNVVLVTSRPGFKPLPEPMTTHSMLNVSVAPHQSVKRTCVISIVDSSCCLFVTVKIKNNKRQLGPLSRHFPNVIMVMDCGNT